MGRLTELRHFPECIAARASQLACVRTGTATSCARPAPSTGSRAQRPMLPRFPLPLPTFVLWTPHTHPQRKLTPSLQEWLSHSRQRHCEICGHAYTFTKGESAHSGADASRCADMKRSSRAALHVKRAVSELTAIATEELTHSLPRLITVRDPVHRLCQAVHLHRRPLLLARPPRVHCDHLMARRPPDRDHGDVAYYHGCCRLCVSCAYHTGTDFQDFSRRRVWAANSRHGQPQGAQRHSRV